VGAYGLIEVMANAAADRDSGAEVAVAVTTGGDVGSRLLSLSPAPEAAAEADAEAEAEAGAEAEVGAAVEVVVAALCTGLPFLSMRTGGHSLARFTLTALTTNSRLYAFHPKQAMYSACHAHRSSTALRSLGYRAVK
jgi:hypothetical protein